jgi:ankyrin repeat protein
MTAVQYNAIESMKLLVAAGADVNGNGLDLMDLPLYNATLTNNLAAAKILIDAKADVKSGHGFESSLLVAARLGFVEMTKLYIAAGADVNMRCQQKYTCLHTLVAACVDGTWTRNKIIFQGNFSELAPFLVDKWNDSPCDCLGVFQVLIDAKADISARGPDGNTPLFIAAVNKNTEAVNALLAAGADANDTDDNGKSVLMAASDAGSLSAVTALVAAGADVNHVCKAENMTALDVALSSNTDDICAVLEKAGAKTLLQLMIETSELVRAASCGDIELVSELVKDADKEEKDMALVAAVRENLCPVVKDLLSAGADPATKHGTTSLLMVAADAGFTDIARELINAGADITTKDLRGKTALQLAAQNKHSDVIVLLLAKAKELKASGVTASPKKHHVQVKPRDDMASRREASTIKDDDEETIRKKSMTSRGLRALVSNLKNLYAMEQQERPKHRDY